MAERSIYLSCPQYPYFEEITVEMPWFGGFALSQVRKCEVALHANYCSQYPKEKPLAVARASTRRLGAELSALNLLKQTAHGLESVESVFQTSKVFYNGARKIGPFPELLQQGLPGKECKKQVKEASRGLIATQYEFEGKTFTAPDYHYSLFYDYLYLSALQESQNKGLKERLLAGGYTSFSDLATTKAYNTQARTCAMFVGLHRAGLLGDSLSAEDYLRMFRTRPDGEPVDESAYENVRISHPGKPHYLTTFVACTVGEEEVRRIFQESYSHLSHKKSVPDYIED